MKRTGTERTLQFIVMVDGPADRREVIGCLKENSCDVRGNWIEVRKNNDADAQRASDEDDGFLYYRFELQATPMCELSEKDQIELVRAIIAAFDARGWRAVVCANFESKV